MLPAAGAAGSIHDPFNMDVVYFGGEAAKINHMKFYFRLFAMAMALAVSPEPRMP
jgi:hypothetical protein